jgi:hypothetical protein
MVALTSERLPEQFECNFVQFRRATLSDAEFIYDLRRTDTRQTLSPIREGVGHQKQYLIDLQADNERAMTERYFILEDCISNTSVGTVRLTELRDESRMGWESLIIREGTRPQIAVDAIFSVYRFCFELLERPLLGPWRVLNSNSQMIRIHQLMDFAVVVDRSKETLWYAVTAESYAIQRGKWLNRGFGKSSVFNQSQRGESHEYSI